MPSVDSQRNTNLISVRATNGPYSASSRLAYGLRASVRVLCRAAAGLTSHRRIILLYHAVGGSRYSLASEKFESQMRYLHEHAEVVSLDAILRGNGTESKRRVACALTFDDGYVSTYENAFPIIFRYGFPSLLYVTTTAIGDNVNYNSDRIPGFYPGERTLSWRQVRELGALGVTIGSHLTVHRHMTELSRAEALTALRQSKDAISQQLGKECKYFAYPFGTFSRQHEALVRECGYETAATVKHRTVPRRCNPFATPRMSVPRTYPLEDFAAMINGDLDYLAVVHEVRRVFDLPYQS